MTVNLGILGFAHGHVSAYCKRWIQDPTFGVNLVAGWDHDSDRLTQRSNEFGVQSYDSLDDFLVHPGLQAVLIGAETSMHADVVEKAAAAGKTIALQKPIAITMQEAERIVDAVNRHNVPFTMAWQMRVDPQNVKMKELIESGELGQIFMVRRRHGLSSQLWDVANMWHFDAALNRDIWADDSAHPIDFIYWLLGEPESVTAELSSLSNPMVPNDNGIAIFRYGNGLLAEVSCSFSCLAAENTTEVIGMSGSIVQNYGDVPSCNVPRPANAPGLKWYLGERMEWTISDIPSPSNHGERIASLAQPLADFFHGRRPPISTVEEGRNALRMVLACYISSQEGRRVRLDDPAIDGV
ncbi:MAG: Gfo/Idh/MocA family oxidoreductase [Chloroflexota bacterium]